MADIPASTKKQRNINRIAATSELVNQASKIISPVTIIPIRATQAIFYGAGFFQDDIKIHEKIINASLCLLAAIELGLSLYLFISGDLCVLESVICRSFMAIDLIYNALMASNFGLSELKKDVFIVNDGSIISNT